MTMNLFRPPPPSRVILERTQHADTPWVAVRCKPDGTELERSPEGTFDEVETYRQNYHRYGAWEKS